MMAAMTRRFLARAVGPVLLVSLLGLFLGLASLVADDAEPADESAIAVSAAAAFEAAYETLQDDFAAAAALSAEKAATLAERTASIRAVRLAYSDFDTTVAPIAIPTAAADDVTAMHVAIEDLIVKFDLQGASSTVAAYREANPAAAAAYTTAKDAIEKVRTTLRLLGRPAPSATATEPEVLPTPGSLQEPVRAPYLKGTRIVGAVKWRDALLAIGATNADTRYRDNDSLGIRDGWIAAFPKILTDAAVVAAGDKAPRNGISGFEVTVPDSTAEPSRENQQYLAFAVRDNKGVCAGGVISGYPALTITTPVNVAPDQVCSGLAVAAAAGFTDE